ncbi:hypothetical protein ACFSX5_10635 [Devosia albogilva]|uniref:Uncharacterized protein n=1 Tax=Devosia albogilva TaxID=429726 RepID=A0ABW5QKN2_9HYPH
MPYRLCRLSGQNGVRSSAVTALVSVALIGVTAGVADDFDMLPHPDNPKGKGTYACTMYDGVSVNDDGRLLRDHWADWFIEDYNQFQFDAETGEFSTEGQQLFWTVLRPGSSAWDLIAHLPGPDASFNMMRIEIWNEPVRFVMTNGKQFFSGTCVRD